MLLILIVHVAVVEMTWSHWAMSWCTSIEEAYHGRVWK